MLKHQVEAPTKESLQQAMNAIDQLIDNPQLPIFDGDLIGLKGSSTRIPVGILHADVLGIKPKIEGPGGSYLKHIQVYVKTLTTERYRNKTSCQRKRKWLH